MTDQQLKDFGKVKRWCDKNLTALYKAGTDLWEIANTCISALFPDNTCSIQFAAVKNYMAVEIGVL